MQFLLGISCHQLWVWSGWLLFIVQGLPIFPVRHPHNRQRLKMLNRHLTKTWVIPNLRHEAAMRPHFEGEQKVKLKKYISAMSQSICGSLYVCSYSYWGLTRHISGWKLIWWYWDYDLVHLCKVKTCHIYMDQMICQSWAALHACRMWAVECSSVLSSAGISGQCYGHLTVRCHLPTHQHHTQPAQNSFEWQNIFWANFKF